MGTSLWFSLASLGEAGENCLGSEVLRFMVETVLLPTRNLARCTLGVYRRVTIVGIASG